MALHYTYEMEYSMPTFLSMAQVARFKDCTPGQSHTISDNGKVTGSIIIPKDLSPILSEPSFAANMLWYIEHIGSVSHTDFAGGLFELRSLSSDKSGFMFRTRYDPWTSHSLSSTVAEYDDLSFPITQLTIPELTDLLLNKSTLETMRWLLSNTTLQNSLKERLKSYITRFSKP
jgi:hypothetical protein